MLYLLLLLFAIILFGVLISSNDYTESKIYLIIGLIMILVSSLRDGADHDYNTYIAYYNRITLLGDYSVEPTFHLISKIIKYLMFDEVILLFFIYAILGIGIKLYALTDLTEFKLLSLMSYFSFYFLMHDMTQIRAGVASAIILLCIKPLYERRYSCFFILASIATLFHYSALSVFFLFFLNPFRINKCFYALLIPLGYILCFLHLDITGILNLIPIEDVQYKVNAYIYMQTYSDNVEMPNIFNVIFVVRCIIAIFILFYVNTISQYNKYVFILLKIYILGLFSFLLFSNVAGFAFRISELYGIVEILLFPFICYPFKQRKIAYGFPILVSTFFLFMELFYVKLLS